MIEKSLELNTKSKIEISAKKKKEVQYELVGNIKPYEGHILWMVDNKTEEIKKAEFTKHPYVWGEVNQKKEVIIIEGFTYISALNIKNAIKKFKKGTTGGKIVDPNPAKFLY